MSNDQVNRERRVRRLLAKDGYRLHKTPSRSALRWYGIGFMVSRNNIVVAGGISRAYDLTLQEVENIANGLCS